MKTRLLSTILFLIVNISVSLAQGHANSSSVGRTDPLPGGPTPIPPPPSCISPATPSISYYTLIPGFIQWYPSYGAIGYHIWVKKKGSSVITVKATVSSPIPPNGIYSCYYTDLPTGTYTIYVSAFSSGCESGISNSLSVTTNGEPIPQNIDPGNDPYALDLDELLDYDKGGDDEESRVATSSTTLTLESKIGETSPVRTYPNPVSSMLNVLLPSGFCSRAKFLVNDVNGRTVELPISISSEGGMQLDTSGIPAGIYFLTVVSDHDNFRQKFVKK